MRHSIIGNTFWNVTGIILPILVAIIAIPHLIRGLGDERFGVLAIGWVVSAYFVISDFGVGVATKQILASLSVSKGKTGVALVWTSLIIHVVLGLFGACALALATPCLLTSVFSIPERLLEESKQAFFWLAVSIFPLMLTAFMRNLLEAYQRFDIVNMLRAPASSLNYLIPILSLALSDSLVLMLALTAAGRTLVMVAHFCFALRVTAELRQPIVLSFYEVRRLLGFGGWVAVSSLVSAIYLVSDRFMVANLFGVAAVTYYITPYEIVTKLWIISASLLGALFPVIATHSRDSSDMMAIYRGTILVLAPPSALLVGFIISFSRDLLGGWIGPEMAAQGGSVAKWIALGVYFSIISQLPLTVLQSTGSPSSVAKVQLLLLPFFVGISWMLSRHFGSVGIAMAWCARNVAELLLIQYQSTRWTLGGTKLNNRIVIYVAIVSPSFLLACWVLESLNRGDFIVRLFGFVLASAAYALASRLMLGDAELRLFFAFIKGKVTRIH